MTRVSFSTELHRKLTPSLSYSASPYSQFLMDPHDRQKVPARRSLKRKLDQDFEEEKADRKVSIVQSNAAEQDLIQDIRDQVNVLNSIYTSDEADRAAAKRAVHALVERAKNGTVFSFYHFLSNCVYLVICLCFWCI